MAKNTGKRSRKGAVKNRTQIKVGKHFIKRDSKTGKFIDVKSDEEPFKGVRKEE